MSFTNTDSPGALTSEDRQQITELFARYGWLFQERIVRSWNSQDVRVSQ